MGLLTWLLAADSVHGQPRVGTVVEGLQSTTTDPSTGFETQYPPSNDQSRLNIPDSHPVSVLDL